MADVNFTDLKFRVAQKLHIIAQTEQLSAEDGAVIEQALIGLESELDRLGILSASFVDGIDEMHAFPVIRMAAARLVDEFDIPEPRRSMLVADGALGVPGRSLAERQLRAIEETPTIKLQTTTDVTVL